MEITSFKYCYFVCDNMTVPQNWKCIIFILQYMQKVQKFFEGLSSPYIANNKPPI